MDTLDKTSRERPMAGPLRIQSQMKGFFQLKKDVLNTVFGSCPVNMSDEDILDAMKSIWIILTK